MELSSILLNIDRLLNQCCEMGTLFYLLPGRFQLCCVFFSSSSGDFFPLQFIVVFDDIFNVILRKV